jgi:hypothetical protein
MSRLRLNQIAIRGGHNAPLAARIVFATSAAAPEGSVNSHSAGAIPFVPGFAFRGRFFGAARFTIVGFSL